MKTSQSYSMLQKLLHWAVVLTFAFNYIVSDGMGRALDAFLKTGVNDTLTAKFHVIVGVVTLALMILRVLVRLIQGAPAMPSAPHPLMEKAAQLVHVGLYAAMILTPMAGASAWFLGVKIAGDAHEVLVNLTVLLILVHVAAALYHQFILKDNLLKRMSLR
ncbi:MAG: cytochrome b/b6 domain-containing protein [Alphaproteobacteria bacterium]|nr:cytochrome b/b6 domain-containing protein [Alphaproteobacteria bacterium]MBU1280421.1 cytochrome b/b6 domain-containing protein [Alphaproteobacteria bacterium]MBU1572426.1 cytochrome b/b6 domain-containing protein [Alphaproteobacteria bacterium]MBU1827092.1 cytochrome b/b6 domain-containing protein [Alphaproteobacteria bacterium]MBU2079362.1 cytochrome b/b6 domain-containing protein [Alphaproteobacteria bacterium]